MWPLWEDFPLPSKKDAAGGGVPGGLWRMGAQHVAVGHTSPPSALLHAYTDSGFQEETQVFRLSSC